MEYHIYLNSQTLFFFNFVEFLDTISAILMNTTPKNLYDKCSIL